MLAGNWKMHNTGGESIALARAIVGGIPESGAKGDIVIAPVYTALAAVRDVISGSAVHLAAQNVFSEDKGAYTGEISPVMLKDVGCEYVIIGHSARRKYFHETDESVNAKVKKALAAGLMPIMCVGETEEEREKGITEFVVGIQIKKALSGIPSLNNIVIAYEPVWAIGTGKVATSIEAEEVHRFIRGVLAEMYGAQSKEVRILYGGSVTPDNVGELIDMEDIDGALVGGASLKPETFIGIITKVAEKR